MCLISITVDFHVSLEKLQFYQRLVHFFFFLIFVILYKSGDTNDCTNYRTTALINHASKILLNISLNRLKAKVEMELSDWLAGYKTERGPTDNILFVLQLLKEKIRKTQDKTFITLIDYIKAFDSVNHNHLFNTMINLGFTQHLVSL